MQQRGIVDNLAAFRQAGVIPSPGAEKAAPVSRSRRARNTLGLHPLGLLHGC